MASLVKQLDEVVSANKNKKMAAVVNLVDIEEEVGVAFAKKHNFENVAVVTCDQKNADRFRVNPEALVTALHYRGKKVVSNHAVAPGKLDDAAITAIVDGAGEILKEQPADKKKEKKEKR